MHGHEINPFERSFAAPAPAPARAGSASPLKSSSLSSTGSAAAAAASSESAPPPPPPPSGNDGAEPVTSPTDVPVALPNIPPPDVLQKLQRTFDSSPKPSLPGMKHISPSLNLPSDAERFRNWAALAEKWGSPAHGTPLSPGTLLQLAPPTSGFTPRPLDARDTMSSSSLSSVSSLPPSSLPPSSSPAVGLGLSVPPSAPGCSSATASSRPSSALDGYAPTTTSSLSATSSPAVGPTAAASSDPPSESSPATASTSSSRRVVKPPGTLPMPRRAPAPAPAPATASGASSSLLQIASQIPTPTPIYSSLTAQSAANPNRAPLLTPGIVSLLTDPPFEQQQQQSSSISAGSPPRSGGPAPISTRTSPRRSVLPQPPLSAVPEESESTGHSAGASNDRILDTAAAAAAAAAAGGSPAILSPPAGSRHLTPPTQLFHAPSPAMRPADPATAVSSPAMHPASAPSPRERTVSGSVPAPLGSPAMSSAPAFAPYPAHYAYHPPPPGGAPAAVPYFQPPPPPPPTAGQPWPMRAGGHPAPPPAPVQGYPCYHAYPPAGYYATAAAAPPASQQPNAGAAVYHPGYHAHAPPPLPGHAYPGYPYAGYPPPPPPPSQQQAQDQPFAAAPVVGSDPRGASVAPPDGSRSGEHHQATPMPFSEFADLAVAAAAAAAAASQQQQQQHGGSSAEPTSPVRVRATPAPVPGSALPAVSSSSSSSSVRVPSIIPESTAAAIAAAMASTRASTRAGMSTEIPAVPLTVPTDITRLALENIPYVPPQKKGNTKRKVDYEALDEKRKEFLERNRKAAMKCRQRKKQQLTLMETKAQGFAIHNEQLDAQIRMFRAEADRLRSALALASDACGMLAHGTQSAAAAAVAAGAGHLPFVPPPPGEGVAAGGSWVQSASPLVVTGPQQHVQPFYAEQQQPPQQQQQQATGSAMESPGPSSEPMDED
ncbi:Transcription factor [Blastocladiella emersonii ATCC 22665]|nr:Transcription factor [Blastocladiella emersonii ATCC 22665]